MGMGWKYFFLKKHVWLGHPSAHSDFYCISAEYLVKLGKLLFSKEEEFEDLHRWDKTSELLMHFASS